MTDWREHLRGIVTRAFPPHARVLVIEPSPNLTFVISGLENPLRRWNRSSRMIQLVIESQALSVYADASEHERRFADARIEGLLARELLRRADSESGLSASDRPRVTRWGIGPADLMGELEPE